MQSGKDFWKSTRQRFPTIGIYSACASASSITGASLSWLQLPSSQLTLSKLTQLDTWVSEFTILSLEALLAPYHTVRYDNSIPYRIRNLYLYFSQFFFSTSSLLAYYPSAFLLHFFPTMSEALIRQCLCVPSPQSLYEYKYRLPPCYDRTCTSDIWTLRPKADTVHLYLESSVQRHSTCIIQSKGTPCHSLCDK